jgi:uncharacterized protein (TIGR03067 family)
MKQHTLAVAAAAALFVGAGLAAAADDKAELVKKDFKGLSGTWTTTSREVDGKKTPEDDLKKARVAFTAEGKVSVEIDGKTVMEGKWLNTDPTKTPKTMDTEFTAGEEKGKTVLGIYDIDGDTLKICVAAPGKDRPTKFAAGEGSGCTMFVYKRSK